MSDDDRDIDIESDDGDDVEHSGHRGMRSIGNGPNGPHYLSQAEKRAHHNALERKRRDHIKDSFCSLRDSVPALTGEKVASRAQILKKASEYIMFMKKRNSVHQQDIDNLKRQNTLLDSQIRTLERAKATGNFAAEASGATIGSDGSFPRESGSDTSDSEHSRSNRRPKKLKVASH